jgi:hypothetical protein
MKKLLFVFLLALNCSAFAEFSAKVCGVLSDNINSNQSIDIYNDDEMITFEIRIYEIRSNDLNRLKGLISNAKRNPGTHAFICVLGGFSWVGAELAYATWVDSFTNGKIISPAGLPV